MCSVEDCMCGVEDNNEVVRDVQKDSLTAAGP